MKKVSRIVGVAAIALLVASFLVGCSDEVTTKKVPKIDPEVGVMLEHYVEVETVGCNSYATLDVTVNTERLKEDVLPYVKKDYDMKQFDMIFDTFKQRIFVNLMTAEGKNIEKTTRLSNGQELIITVNAMGTGLKEALTIDVVDVSIEYTVKGLEDFKGFDESVFDFYSIFYDELVECDGEIGYMLGKSAELRVKMPNGTVCQIICDVDAGADPVKLGDTVHLSFSEGEAERYEEVYGKGIFGVTEADIVLKYMSYLPVGDNAEEIFDVIDDSCLANAQEAMEDLANYVTDTESSQAECIGMMLYYEDEGKLIENSSDYKWYNQLVMVYKITNEDNTDGWYSYLAYNGYMSIGYTLDKETLNYVKVTGDIYGSHMSNQYKYYYNEHPMMFEDEPFANTFEKDGVTYPGHEKLADVMEAIRQNMLDGKSYAHLAVTDSLSELISEY